MQRVRAGGVDVRLDVAGPVTELPTELSSAAYRIVQESLTNVLRHADAGEALVRVVADEGTLEVDVTDQGRGGDLTGDGTGIRGMRERAAALGGTLDAGPASGGGFRVTARLPVPARTAEPAR